MEFLLTVKSGIRNAAFAVTECATPEVRALVKGMLFQGLQTHEQLSTLMVNKGWLFPTQPAHQLEVDIRAATRTANIAELPLFKDRSKVLAAFDTPQKPMRAVTYQGVKAIEVKNVPDPRIEKPDNMIVRITSSAICGSDLHLLHGLIPNLNRDYIIGHEPTGVVEEIGPGVTNVKKGDRVIIPFNVACGEYYYCTHHLESQREGL